MVPESAGARVGEARRDPEEGGPVGLVPFGLALRGNTTGLLHPAQLWLLAGPCWPTPGWRESSDGLRPECLSLCLGLQYPLAFALSFSRWLCAHPELSRLPVTLSSAGPVVPRDLMAKGSLVSVTG